jgi:ribosomal-protein-serine acetyltransferase
MSHIRRRVLQTPRLTLEPTGPEHAAALYELSVVSAPELEPFMAWMEDISPAATKAFTTEAARGWDQATGWSFTIVCEGKVAGTVGLEKYMPLWASAEIGYWMDSRLAGRGLMTEAASAVVAFGFEEVGLHRISLQAAPENAGSLAVARKLGFEREGLLRDASRGVAEYHDCVIFGLLESDPQPRHHLT